MIICVLKELSPCSLDVEEVIVHIGYGSVGEECNCSAEVSRAYGVVLYSLSTVNCSGCPVESMYTIHVDLPQYGIVSNQLTVMVTYQPTMATSTDENGIK